MRGRATGIPRPEHARAPALSRQNPAGVWPFILCLPHSSPTVTKKCQTCRAPLLKAWRTHAPAAHPLGVMQRCSGMVGSVLAYIVELPLRAAPL